MDESIFLIKLMMASDTFLAVLVQEEMHAYANQVGGCPFDWRVFDQWEGIGWFLSRW